MNVLRVLLILFLLLILIGLVKLKLDVRYCGRDGMEVFFRVLFFKFKIFPKKLGRKEVGNLKVCKKKKERKVKKKDGMNFKKLFKNFKIFLDPLPGTLKFLNKGFKIKNLEVDWSFAKGDAFDTAVEYGKICGLFFWALGVVFKVCSLSVKKINVVPDFVSERSSLFFVFRAQIGIGVVVCGFFKYLFEVILNLVFDKLKFRVSEKECG